MQISQTKIFTRRRGFFVLVLVGVFGIGALFGAKMDAPVKALFKPEQPPQRYVDRLERLEQFPPNGDIALIGDSHVQRGPWRVLLSAGAANFGVGGDDVAGVVRRIGALEQETVVVWVGVNDLIMGQEPGSVALGLCEAGREFEGRLVILTIAPVYGRYARYNRAIVEANDRIIGSECLKRATIVDIWPSLLADGELAVRFSNDGLHLNAGGYLVVSDRLQKALGALN